MEYKFQAYNEGLVFEDEITFSKSPLIQRVFHEHLKTSMFIKTVWFVTLTCSAALFSTVLGRFEDSGLSEASDREEGLLEGIGESDWRRSEWPDTAAHSHKHGGIKRGEQTCQGKVRTWQPGSRSINNSVDKGLWNAFLKCDITAFNGNWAERVLLSNSCLPIKNTKHFLLVFLVSFNVGLSRYHTTQQTTNENIHLPQGATLGFTTYFQST